MKQLGSSSASTPTQEQPQLLFVDSDALFLVRIKKDRKASIIPPLTAQLGSEAVKYLVDLDLPLHAIFVSQSVCSPDAVSVIRRARQLRPRTPIFLMHDGERCAIDESILKKLGNCEVIPKNFTYAEIAQRFYSAAQLFDPSEARGDGTALNEVRRADDSGFLAIRAETFVSGSKSLFDVYVRVGTGRYLKILKSGDDFSKDRVGMYLGKGVTHFHVPKVAEADYLAYAHKLTESIVQHPSVPADTKVRQTSAHGESVLGLLKQKEVLTSEAVKYGETYVGLVHTLVSQLDVAGQSTLVTSLLNHPAQQEHFVSTILLGGLFARALGFETQKSASLIGMGCLLHDVGLFGDPEGLEMLSEDEMNDAQRAAYFEHPSKGARILKEIRGLNPAIPQIVLNHHRRRNGTGFPNQSGLGSTQLTAPIEIVAVADELIRICVRNAKLPPEELRDRIKRLVLPSFSGEVAEAVVNVLRIEI
jgi:hypothetical protein